MIVRVVCAVLIAACVAACAHDATAAAEGVPVISAATNADEAGFVSLGAEHPDLRMDIRYAGSHNFIGTPIDGYDAADCQLLRPVADALLRVERTLLRAHQRLLVFDCYRPARAVAHFMRWARDPDAPGNKAEFYAEVDKDDLVPQYIAERSGHSRGATLDLTIMQCGTRDADCRALDMGTQFDVFGKIAHTDSPEMTALQRSNRHRLRDAMAAQGFVNYPDEWWHYTLQPEPMPETAYDFPVR